MTKKSINKKAVLAVAVFIVVLIAIFFIQKRAEEEQNKERWVKQYMKRCAGFTMNFDDMPQDIEAWEDWRPLDAEDYFGYLTINDNEVIGENILDTLADCYRSLTKTNIMAPDNSQCQELFEKLEPYFQKAFVWEADTSAGECVQRLKELGTETVMDEVWELAKEVDALYDAYNVERRWYMATGADLQMMPEKLVSSGDLQMDP